MTEPIIIIPEPTGFAANLERDRQRSIAELADKSDMNSSPTKLANLGWMNSIVQFSKVVGLLGQILVEVQESKTAIQPGTWVDAKGIYFNLIVENGAIYTYLCSGVDHQPVEPSRPISEASILGGIELLSSTLALSEPRYTRRKGQEELTIAPGATRISIAVLAGEVTCSHGDGAIPGGVPPLVFVSDRGLTGMTLQGDADADYVVTMQYPVAAAAEEIGGIEVSTGVASPIDNPEPIIAETDIIAMPDLDLTGDLLPAMTELVS